MKSRRVFWDAAIQSTDTERQPPPIKMAHKQLSFIDMNLKIEEVLKGYDIDTLVQQCIKTGKNFKNRELICEIPLGDLEDDLLAEFEGQHTIEDDGFED